MKDAMNLSTVVNIIISYVEANGGKIHREQLTKFLKDKYKITDTLFINALLEALVYMPEGFYSDLRIIGSFYCTPSFFMGLQKNIMG